MGEGQEKWERLRVRAKAGPGSGATSAISPRETGALLPTHTEDGCLSDHTSLRRPDPDLLRLANKESVSSAQPIPVSEQIPGKNTSVEKPGSWKQGS